MIRKLLSCLTLLVAINGALCLCPINCNNETTTTVLGGACPTITNLKNLNPLAIQGAGFRRYSTDTGDYLGCEGCITSYGARYDDNTLEISECCRRGCEIRCGDVGSGKLYVDPEDSSRYLYDSYGVLTPYWILDTDCRSYTIYYTCYTDGCTRKEAVYIDTKTPIIGPVLENYFYSVLAANDIDTSAVVSIDHHNCPYIYFP